jgi:preprotein translocase subunit YajC
MFISPAYAQAFGDANQLVQIAPFALILVVFYFFLIRPQQQKAKEHKTMLTALRRGDRVITGGGIIGTIAKVVNDDEVAVEIADGLRVRVVRSTITGVMAKTEPVSAKSDKDKGEDKDAEAGEADADADKRKGSARRAGGSK